jgi:hypothetical protein
MNWIKENWFKLGILLILLFIAWTFYYKLVVLPGIESNREQAQATLKELKEKSERESIEASRNRCLSAADIDYSLNWNSACKSLGKKEDCTLPTLNANNINDFRQSSRDECYKKYPVN